MRKPWLADTQPPPPDTDDGSKNPESRGDGKTPPPEKG